MLAVDMKLWSDDFEHEGSIPRRFTCDGEDISPHLAWSDAPPETHSFALTVIDPDAPRGDWIHWLVYNIPKDVSEIPRGGPVPGKEVTNDFGKTSYGGPCPPYGVHRYYFTLYALRGPPSEPVTKENFVAKVKELAIASAQLMGRYSRK